MIHFRKEGEEIKTGFNFYSLFDAGSVGFIFKWKIKIYWCRYSKKLHKLILMKTGV